MQCGLVRCFLPVFRPHILIRRTHTRHPRALRSQRLLYRSRPVSIPCHDLPRPPLLHMRRHADPRHRKAHRLPLPTAQTAHGIPHQKNLIQVLPTYSAPPKTLPRTELALNRNSAASVRRIQRLDVGRVRPHPAPFSFGRSIEIGRNRYARLDRKSLIFPGFHTRIKQVCRVHLRGGSTGNSGPAAKSRPTGPSHRRPEGVHRTPRSRGPG
jgi:hypothetical protein